MHYCGPYLKLHELPFWCDTEDLDILAEALYKSPRAGARHDIKYLAAPPCSGPTLCISPAFLRSTVGEGGFTHFLYMAFANNDNREFTPACGGDLSLDIDLAECQGAAFIVDCLRSLLESTAEGVRAIRCQANPPEVDESKCALQSYIDGTYMRLKQRCKFLVQIDEHHQMCLNSNKEIAAAFRRGVLSTLGSAVAVVATYTSCPPVPPEHSSAVCRTAVTLPSMDVDQMLDAYEELRMLKPGGAANSEYCRLYRTFHFRLAVKVKQMGLSCQFIHVHLNLSCCA